VFKTKATTQTLCQWEKSRTECKSIISLQVARRASKQRSLRRLVVGVNIGIRALGLEVAVVSDTYQEELEQKKDRVDFSVTPTRARASSSHFVGPRAAVRRVSCMTHRQVVAIDEGNFGISKVIQHSE